MLIKIKRKCREVTSTPTRAEKDFYQEPNGARPRWLMPVILSSQEAEIRRIAIKSQPRQIVYETLSQKTHHTKGLLECLKM
jgi:hypothetical protein